MKKKKFLSKQGTVPNLPVGIGYITIPSDISREEYIKNCLGSSTIMIRTESNVYKDVYIDEDKIKKVQFPEKISEYGSLVVWVNVPKDNRLVIVAILKSNTDIKDEFQYTIEQISDICSVIIDMNATKRYFSANIVSEDDPANFEINVKSPNSDSKASIYVQGDINVQSDKSITMTTKDAVKVKLITDKGEQKFNFSYDLDEGMIIEDQYSNIYKTDEDGVSIKSEKISLGTIGKSAESAVLGEKTQTKLEEILSETDDINNEFQTLNNSLITFCSTQITAISSVPVLAPLAPAYTALLSIISGVTPRLLSISAEINIIKNKLGIIKSNKVTLD